MITMSNPIVRTTSSHELVTCCTCGNRVMQRYACGVGSGGQFTWTCTYCAYSNTLDHTPAGGMLDQVIASPRKAGFRGNDI